MTLRALKIKNSPALGLLRVTLQKNIGSIVLLCIATLIFCPGFFITILSKTTFRPEDYTSPDALDSVFGITAVFSSIFVCIANYVNFSYLYKKSSSDVFHALPITRGAMLFARAAAGFVGVLIPVTIGYVSLAFLTIPYPTYAIGTLSQIASAYLVNVLLMLAFSGYSLIFILCAGNGFDLAVSFGGFNIAVFAIAAIISGLCGSYLSGYHASDFDAFIRFLSPIYNLADRGVVFADGGYTLKGIGNTVFGILEFAAAFFIIAPLLYRYRKAERGEQAYAYKFIYVICGVLAGICGGYALSEIFTFAANQKEYSIIGFVAFILGALITTVVYGAVTNRGFKGFKKSMMIGGISAIAYALIAVIIISGAFGFEKRIPEPGKVTAVTVSASDVTVNFKNPEAAIALHRAILEKGADDDYRDDVDSSHDYIGINYNLSGKGEAGNGDMQREYFVKLSLVKEELFKIYSSDERFAEFEKLIDKASNNKIDISGDYNVFSGDVDKTEILSGQISKADAKKILSVYRKELNAAGAEIFTEKGQTGKIATVYFEAENGNVYEMEGFYTTAAFKETNKLLKAYGEEELEPKETEIE